MASVFGATTWFFFVQSPVLLKSMGRDQFVPIQMRLTVVLFKVLTALLVIMLGASLVHDPVFSGPTISAVIALAGCLLNQFFVIPKALKAGGRGRNEVQGRDSEASTTTLASHGVGDQTQLLHRLVVLFVVIMLAATVVHGIKIMAT